MAALPGVTWNKTSAINEDRQLLKITVDVVAHVWSLPYIKNTELVKKKHLYSNQIHAWDCRLQSLEL